MTDKRCGQWLLVAALVVGLGFGAPRPAAAQQTTGINWQGFTVHQGVDLGGRWSTQSGNANNYDTFVNLQQGLRLFSFNLAMNAPAASGRLFNSLILTGFGFGGDPDTVAHLAIAKSKVYAFDARLRRDVYYFGWNLQANPLNAAGANPATMAITAPLHQLNFLRTMGDYNLTLAPQSSFQVRLGYSHIGEGGPSYTTVGAAMAPGVGEVGIDTVLVQDYKTSSDLYRAGFDYTPFARTRISFTEVVQHTKGDTALQDQNYLYQLAGGTPLDLGVAFSSTSPCAAPIVSAATTPPTANPACQGILTYVGDNRPRITMPTEQLTFQSSYFSKLTLDGVASYSSGKNTADATQANWRGYSSRLTLAGNNDLGNGVAKRVLINGDLGAVYTITEKLRLTSDASYNAFRLPSALGFITSNFFYPKTTAPLASTIAPFNATTCPAPYTAATCPQHSSSAPADAANGTTSDYLGQNLGRETIQVAYSITPRWNLALGYRYTYRAIYDGAAINYAAEAFDPGGATGAAAAARGDCAVPKGATFPTLPAGCTLQSDGSIVFSGAAAGSQTGHALATLIHGDSALVNTWIQPANNLTLSLAVELYSGDNAFTRITPRQSQHYIGKVRYQPADWAQINGTVDDLEGNNNLAEDQFKEHDRSFGFSATLAPQPSLMFDLGYNYEDLYNQAVVCYATTPAPAAASKCPIASSPVTIGSLSTYSAKTNFFNADLSLKPVSAFTLRLGMSASYSNGVPVFFNLNGVNLGNFINPLTPFGGLQISYQQPYADFTYAMTNNVAYHLYWGRYLYTTHGQQNPAGLAPIGGQNFDTDNLALSLQLTM